MLASAVKCSVSLRVNLVYSLPGNLGIEYFVVVEWDGTLSGWYQEIQEGVSCDTVPTQKGVSAVYSVSAVLSQVTESFGLSLGRDLGSGLSPF